MEQFSFLFTSLEVTKMKEYKFTIFGRIIGKTTKQGMPNVTIEVLDNILLVDNRLGAVITDKNGKFMLSYDCEDYEFQSN